MRPDPSERPRRNRCGAPRPPAGRSRRIVIGLLAVIMLTLPGCAAIVDAREDARIEAEVKARLVAERNANLTRLGVTSTEAIVRLTGAVESAGEKARAEAIAKEVPGVKRVVNNLEVR